MKLKNFINPNNKNSSEEYNTTDFDTKSGWHWKHTDHLLEMGFQLEGETRLKLSDKKDFEKTLNVEIYKRKAQNDYVMEVNGRKHHFRSFDEMLSFIESAQLD